VPIKANAESATGVINMNYLETGVLALSNKYVSAYQNNDRYHKKKSRETVRTEVEHPSTSTVLPLRELDGI
jgi:hypothetical protein